MPVKIEKLSDSNINAFIENAKGTYLAERKEILERYLAEKNERLAIVATLPGVGAVGYATLVRKSHYPYFDGIPEIMDLNTIEKYRGQGVASAMLDYLENDAKECGYKTIGIGVGLYADYGPAQRLYIKRGYIPDGKGAVYDGKPVIAYDSYPIDDSLALYMTKKL